MMWPGFGDHIRVLKWIHGRVTGGPAGAAREACLGWLPAEGALDMSGLTPAQQAAARELLAVSPEEWREDLLKGEAFLVGKFGEERLPPALLAAGRGLIARASEK